MFVLLLQKQFVDPQQAITPEIMICNCNDKNLRPLLCRQSMRQKRRSKREIRPLRHQHLLLVVYGNIRSGIERNWSNLALGQFDALRRGQHRRYLGHQLLPLLILDDATKKAVGDIAESMRGKRKKTVYYGLLLQQ